MSTYDNTRDELRALRKQMDQLMEDRLNPAISDAAHRAGEAAQRARAYTGEKADVVADRVRDMPLVSVAVAAIVGFLFGRITR